MEEFIDMNCFSQISQEFLISVTVYQARDLVELNITTYVKVTLDNQTQTTRNFSNSENPYFNEYFVFELKCTLTELLHYNIIFEVKKKALLGNKTVGQFSIDLQAIWKQPHHSFLKKWGRLENPADKTESPNGYLLIDVCILTREDSPSPIKTRLDIDNIEKNLLKPKFDDLSKFKCHLFIYKGMFVASSNYFVQVTASGIKGRTKVVKNTQYAEWNEEFVINWSYPSLSETIFIQIMNTEFFKTRSLSYYEINLNQIKFSENDLMTLGPTYIHFYESEFQYHYIGRLLIEVECNKLEKLIPRRGITLKLINPIIERAYWKKESFLIECLIWCGDFLHTVSNRIKVYMKCGESISNKIDFKLSNNKKITNLKYFFLNSPFKTLYTYITYPDNRLKNYADYYVTELYEHTKILLENFSLFNLRNYTNESTQKEYLLWIIKKIISKLIDGLENLEFNNHVKLTEYDNKKMIYLRDFLNANVDDLNKFSSAINTEKNIIQIVIKYLKLMCDKLENIIRFNIDDNWPNLYIIIRVEMEDVAVCTLNAKDYIYHDSIKYRGSKCGKRNQLVFKLYSCQHSCKHCGCIFGKLDACIWIGTQSEYDATKNIEFWERINPFNYNFIKKFEIKEEYICKVYIHQAKIKPGYDPSGACDPRISVTFLNYNKDTTTILQTCLPIWNEVITFEGFSLPGTLQSYVEQPLLLAIKLFDKDKYTKDDILGIGLIRIKLFQGNSSAAQNNNNNDNNTKSEKKITKFFKKLSIFHANSIHKEILPEDNLENSFTKNEEEEISPPILKWVKVTKNGCVSAEVLMSCELIRSNEQNLKKIVKLSKDLPAQIIPIMKKFFVEVVFIGLREFKDLPYNLTAGKYKIHLTIGDLMLASGPSGDKLNKSINFMNMYASGLVNLPEQLEYWPSMIITHLDAHKARSLSIGISSILEPAKFLINEFNEFRFLDKISFETIQGYNKEKIVISKEPSEKTNLLGRPKRVPSINFMRRLINVFLNNVKYKISYLHLENNQDEDENENLFLLTWWTKFYYSQSLTDKHARLMEQKHELVIYDSELENQSEFESFHDWAKTYYLYQELKEKHNAIPSYEHYAKIKIRISIRDNVKINESEKSFNDHHVDYEALEALGGEINILVRIYIIRAFNLRSFDKYSAADPFIKIRLGSKTINDAKNYIVNQSNPIFGKIYELEATIPNDHLLYISVYDHGGRNVLIGETEIDLEDRLKSKYHANVGIPKEYSSQGYNLWRDIQKPYQILKNICTDYFIEDPNIIDQNTIVVDGITFHDSTIISDDPDYVERLSLSVLNRLNELPKIGYNLVPEHVETRSLYRNDRPGIEQGKLQLWIDLFQSDNVPSPINISPAPAQEYEVRIIVYNTEDFRLRDTNLFGQKMSDIYVKAWFDDKSKSQKTDVHYRSKHGEGKFNWRMKFDFLYSEAEQMTIVKKKEKYQNEFTELRQPPLLFLQIWDKDVFSADDLLGAMDINLRYFKKPFETAKDCTFDSKKTNYLNLFKEKQVRGWFPCKGISETSDSIVLGGKIELELQLMTAGKAIENPAGVGREPPSALPEPERSITSFNPLIHPIKAFKYIIRPILNKAILYCCGCLVITILLCGLVFSAFNSLTHLL